MSGVPYIACVLLAIGAAALGYTFGASTEREQTIAAMKTTARVTAMLHDSIVNTDNSIDNTQRCVAAMRAAGFGASIPVGVKP